MYKVKINLIVLKFIKTKFFSKLHLQNTESGSSMPV